MLSGNAFVVTPFVTKLRHGSRLTAGDVDVLGRLAAATRKAEARSDIMVEGNPQRWIPLVLAGWTGRYRQLANGKHQITTLYLPGDLCEPFGILPNMLHDNFAGITPTTYAMVGLSDIQAATQSHPNVNKALWWDLLVTSSIEREHIVSLGRRSATERLAHFICEIDFRLKIAGQYRGGAFDMPITQQDLGDLLGLSTVQVNRSLQELRRAKLIALGRGRLAIHNLEDLRDLALFDDSYFHIASGTERASILVGDSM